MRKFILPIALVIIGISVYVMLFRREQNPPLALQNSSVAAANYKSQHSSSFNQSMKGTLSAYYALSEAFVNWDSAGIRAHAASLADQLVALPLEELKKDTLTYTTAVSHKKTFGSDLQTIMTEKDLTVKRRRFHVLSGTLYDLLRTVRYDGATVFLQECPMAFNDTETAVWLSSSNAIRNPYLGLHHPRYKSGMLECGETKDSLHFSVPK